MLYEYRVPADSNVLVVVILPGEFLLEVVVVLTPVALFVVLLTLRYFPMLAP